MSEENETESPSIKTGSNSKVNKMLRVLKGERLEFTIHLLMTDGVEYEFQSANQPNAVWDDSAREVLLRYDAGGHGYTPVCSWSKVVICRCERNPK